MIDKLPVGGVLIISAKELEEDKRRKDEEIETLHKKVKELEEFKSEAVTKLLVARNVITEYLNNDVTRDRDYTVTGSRNGILEIRCNRNNETIKI